METFSALLALCAGNLPVTGEFPSQRPVTRSFDIFSLICAWINGWVNNGEAGDLRRNFAHYDVIVMCVVHHGISHNKYLCACYLSRFRGTTHRPRSLSQNPSEVFISLICLPTVGFSKWVHLKRKRVYDLWQIPNWWIWINHINDT